jgi:hypothetical protein
MGAGEVLPKTGRKELGPETIEPISTEWSLENLDRGTYNIPNAIRAVATSPRDAAKYLVGPIATGAGLGATNGSLPGALIGGAAGALAGLSSYGNPAMSKLLADVDEVAPFVNGPPQVGMVGVGGRAFSAAEHDDLLMGLYEKLPQLAKSVRARMPSGDVEEMVGNATTRLLELFRNPQFKNFPTTNDLDDYLHITARRAMEDSTSRQLANTGKELTEAVAQTAMPTQGVGGDNQLGALDRLMQTVLRPRDRVIYERTKTASTQHAGPHPVQSSQRSLANELGVNRRRLGQEIMPQVEQTMQEVGQQLQTGSMGLDQAVDSLLSAKGIDFGRANKAYRKDLPKMHSPELVAKAIQRLPSEVQGPMRDYMRGLTPAQLDRKWDGPSKPDRLYQAFQELEKML